MINDRLSWLRLTCLIFCLFWHFPSRADGIDRGEPPVTDYQQALALELLTRIDEALQILSSQNQDGTLERVLADYSRNIRDALEAIRRSYNGNREQDNSLALLSLKELLNFIEGNAGSNLIESPPEGRRDHRPERRLAAISFNDMEPRSSNRFAVLYVERSLRFSHFNAENPSQFYATIFALILCFQPHNLGDSNSIRLGASIATSQWLHAVNSTFTALTNAVDNIEFWRRMFQPFAKLGLCLLLTAYVACPRHCFKSQR